MKNNKNIETKILISGVIIKVLTSNSIIVELENKMQINCYLSKKIKRFNLNIISGDKVDVEISPLDLKRGKIIYRHIVKIKNNES